jgi:hypothetical protein
MLPPFIEFVDTGAVFVRPPTVVIFLCGGKTKHNSASFASIRDAFLKVENNPATSGRQVMLAESVNTFHLSRPAYPELLSFEVDLAQLCELILLFSESQGSIAELGAFSMIDEIARKLLVVVRDYHLRDDSFIKLGPLRHLQLKYGDHSVFIINDDETGINLTSLKELNIDVLRDRVCPAIDDRFSAVLEHTTFDPKRNGHVIKLMVGLIQEFGGLTAPELRSLLHAFGAELAEVEVDRLLLCAEAVKWVAREQRGFSMYYFAVPLPRDALTLKFHKGAPIFNRERRRQTFREHWAAADEPRLSGISKFAGAAE